MSVFRTNLTGKNRNTGRCRGVFGFLQFFKIMTLYAETWGRGLANIGQRDLHPPMGYPPPTPQEQAPTAPFLRFALLILSPSENGGYQRPPTKKNKKISGYTVRGSGSCGWGYPPPLACVRVYRFCNLLKYRLLRGFFPHNNPDGCNREPPIKTVRQPTGCNREPPVFTPVRLR